jgi:hypothetical protein
VVREHAQQIAVARVYRTHAGCSRSASGRPEMYRPLASTARRPGR